MSAHIQTTVCFNISVIMCSINNNNNDGNVADLENSTYY